jgi:hypothetical protein
MKPNNDIIESLAEEETNLVLHTKLCAQRYQQITDRLANMDDRFDKIESGLIEIKNIITKDTKDNYKMYLGWASVIIVTLTSSVGFLLAHYVFK